VWPEAIVASVLLSAIACDPGTIGTPGGAAGSNAVRPGGPGAGGSSSGNPGDPTNPGDPSDPGSAGSSGSSGAGGTKPTVAEQVAKCENAPTNPGPTFMRRLNKFEYTNTVRDLLGVDGSPADQFPSEEKRLGFDNNATALQVSPALVEQYMLAAESLADTAVKTKLSTVLPCDASGGDACAAQFIGQFGQRAYRRPLTTAENATLKGVFDVGNKTNFNTGVQLVIETVLQSAPFLYRVEFGSTPAANEKFVRPTSYEMASRLSYLVWQSMPDEELFAAADAGQLDDPTLVATQVDRMMKDPKAHDVFNHFHQQWLQLDKQKTIDKDATVFPAFSAALGPFMEQETQRFLDYVVWEGGGSLNDLLTSQVSFVNGPLATYYGVQGVSGNDFVKVNLDAKTRPGILTRGGLMAMLGKANQSDPVHRGKFVREQLLCNMLPPPPANIVIKAPEVNPNLSTRDRFAAHRTEALCNSCHTLMDPIGFGFENYDGAGRYRTTENGAAIDATGQVNQSDIPGTFDGASDLATRLAGSDQVKQCVTTSWFRYAYGRAETSDDECTLASVNEQFAKANYDLKSLVVALAGTDAFLYRNVIPAGGAQ
jgi:hypothetical protein